MGWSKTEGIKNDPRYLEPLISQLRKAQIKTLTNTVTVQADNAVVSMGIETYNKAADILWVFSNSTFLMKGKDYSIGQDGSYIQNLTSVWAAGTEIDFVVMKNIEVDSNVIVTNGSQIADGSISDRKLAANIKPGFLSELYTLDKSSFVNAINEAVTDVNEANDSIVTINNYLNGMKTSFNMEALDINFYVDKASGNDSNDGSQAKPFKSIQKALDSIPPFSAASRIVNVYVAAGTYLENLIIKNKLGGKIYLFGNKDAPTTVKFGSLYAEDIYSYFRIEGFQATTTTSDGIFYERCSYANTSSCIADGNNKSGGFSGILYSASSGRCQNNTTSNGHNGISAIYSSNLAIDSDNKGTGNTYGIRSSRSTIYKEGPNTIAGVAKEGVLQGGIISNGGTIG